jgi:succinoglycan biosynthesis transport protein ExoP
VSLIEIFHSRKNWFLILGLCLALGLTAGYLSVRLQAPVYQATAKILVVQTQSNQFSDLLSLNNQQLVQTYIELLQTKPIFDAASAKLGVVIDPHKVSVMQASSNQIIHVTVEDSDSQRAAQIANALIQVLIEQSIKAESDQYSTYETTLNSKIQDAQKQINSLQEQIKQISEVSIQEQITQVNGQIAQLVAEIAALKVDIANFPLFPTPAQQASLVEKETQLEQRRSLLNIYQQTQVNLITTGSPTQGNTSGEDARIASLRVALNIHQQHYLTLTNDLQTLQSTHFQNTPNVTQIDPAVPSAKPILPKPLLYIIMAGTAGLVLGFGIILLLVYFDKTLKSSNDAEELLGLSVLGKIPNQKQPIDGPIVANHPNAREAQGFRKLGAVLELTNRKKIMQILVVTSPEAGEGKTTVAANLASAYSRQGKRVLLIDANFNHPSLHTLLRLNDEHGFAEILQGDKEIAPQHYYNGDERYFLVLPAGKSPQPDELYRVENVAQVLSDLQKQVDLLILDAPPLSNAAASMLAIHANGVLIIIKSGHTKISSAISATQQLKRQGAQILGIVLNFAAEGY